MTDAEDFNRETLARLMRLVGKHSAQLAVEGSNPELVDVREHMPEPTRYDYPAYQVPLHRNEPIAFRDWTDMPVMTPIRRAVFDRVLVKDAAGTTFWAWQNTEDKCVYI